MKKSNTYFFIIISCLSIFLYGCSNKTDKFEAGLLWKISGNGLKKPSYILGIDNLINTNFLGRINGFEQTFDSTKVLIREIDIDEDKSKSASDTIRKIGELRLGKGYKERLSETDYNRLNNGLMDVFKSSVEEMKNLYPTLILSTYTKLNYYSTDSTYNPMCHESMDLYLDKKAKEKGMKTIGLENLDEKINSIIGTDSTFEREVKVLICNLENKETNKKIRSEYNAFYKEQSLGGIDKLLTTNRKNDSCQTLLSDNLKNVKNSSVSSWATKLAPLMNDSPSFIAISAFYLGGEDGLLTKLEKMGYTIERVQ